MVGLVDIARTNVFETISRVMMMMMMMLISPCREGRDFLLHAFRGMTLTSHLTLIVFLPRGVQVVLDKTVREILMREGVVPVSAKGFYDHFANGEHSQRMYDDVNFIRGVEIVGEIDKLIEANDDSVNR